MPATLLIRCANSHLYPGCIVRLPDVPRSEEVAAVVEFADGAGTTATCVRRGRDECELTVDAYTTRKGHPVESKRWLLQPLDGERQAWRVRQRLP